MIRENSGRRHNTEFMDRGSETCLLYTQILVTPVPPREGGAGGGGDHPLSLQSAVGLTPRDPRKLFFICLLVLSAKYKEIHIYEVRIKVGPCHNT